MDFTNVFQENRTRLIIGLLGLFLLVGGAFSLLFMSYQQSQPEVEIISSDEKSISKEDQGRIAVDVEGAVESPGLYYLQSGSRVQEVLVAAGGYAAEADRDWVAKYINLAQPLSDGVKIYIPFSGEEAGVVSGGGGNVGEVIGARAGSLININTASLGELDSLWGIGEKRAMTIVQNRPYGSIEELVEKDIIPMNVFERIKTQISVY